MLKNRIHFTFLATIVFVFSGAFGSGVHAQTSSGPTPAAQDPTYQKFLDNHRTNPDVAYQAAQDYLRQYGTSAAPNDKVASYLRQWIAAYEKYEQFKRLLAHISAKQIDEAFALGKTLLENDPDDLAVLFTLTLAGWEDLYKGGRTTTHLAKTKDYALRAIRLLEGGKSFSVSNPLTEQQRNENIGGLKLALGWLLRRSAPSEAVDYLIDAARRSEKVRRTPDTYGALAAVYEEYYYAPSAAAYKEDCQTAEQTKTQACIDTKTRADAAAEVAIDALARAIAYSNEPELKAKFDEQRQRWMKSLETLYKDRHNGSIVGLPEMLERITSKPLRERIK